MEPNVKAFLDTLAISEGTYGIGDGGYNVLVGGSLFNGYSKHPNTPVRLNSKGLVSTAAGRYQILYRSWVALRDQLHLPDFSPASQDAAAIELIRQRSALADVKAGRFDQAVQKCSNIWASLPGAGYGQRENSLESLRDDFVSHGGQLA